MNKYKSLTFLEVLITLTILSIVSILVVGLLKPQETFKAARDTKRITSIKQIEKAIELYLTENQSLDLGSSTIIYISLPDNSPTCSAWISQLPPLPSGYEYRCSANPQNIDGTGWIPIDFTKSSITNISSLSTDPINSPPYYFAYVADNNKKSFEITAYLESERNKGENSVSANDYGTNIYLYEGGSDRTLLPLSFETQIALKSGDLVFLYTFNPTNQYDNPYAIKIEGDYIYIAGDAGDSGNVVDSSWIIEKRNKNNWNLIWSVTSNPSLYNDEPRFIALDNDYLYIVGTAAYYSSNRQWRIEKRLKVNGELVMTILPNFSSSSIISRIIIDNNYIYAGGSIDDTTSDPEWVLFKINKNTGNIENTLIYNPSNSYDSIASIAQDEEYLYLAGYDSSLGVLNTQWRIQKRNKDNLNLIWERTVNPSNGGGQDDFITDISYKNGYLYIVGSYVDSNYYGWRYEKRDVNGNVIWIKTSNPSTGWDWPCCIILDDNFLYTAGYEEKPGGDKMWRIEKRNVNNGDLIYAVNSNPSNAPDFPHSIEIDDAFVYIAGQDYSPGSNDTQWRIEKRVK